MTPEEVLELRRQYLIDRDFESFADLFAEDGVIEMPFALQGVPDRLVGRAAIREFSLKAGTRAVEITDLRTVQLHRTTDPEVVILELVTEARHTTTDVPFQATCIQVFRIQNGKIKLFRDYVGAHSVPDLT
ncbi:nuclear transport factor 2 family protein [Kribbella jiaozuonensis]|uniref:Nuclear transport factor 2 family protein n=1 Tax=Kribbella jiaozuonensis TaxID=2575441 RepID=A0A4U3LPD5_9ACTN|nr:nuclear transport factor 2 family protein [Kribbella jiaozuonensis]TKK77711.1 nuclear transport factor 2 family protein [Kribbella jiaozuonensis]